LIEQNPTILRVGISLEYNDARNRIATHLQRNLDRSKSVVLLSLTYLLISIIIITFIAITFSKILRDVHLVYRNVIVVIVVDVILFIVSSCHTRPSHSFLSKRFTERKS
jgi:hypothetical protein